MRVHALRVGAFFVIAYVACLLWPLTMTDPEVINFHLLSLKTLLPGFQGYTPLSVLWGGLLTFAYGFLISLAFHSMHMNCCDKKNGLKKIGNALFPDHKKGIVMMTVVFMLGVAVGLALTRPAVLSFANDSTPFMKNKGAAMMQWGQMMREDGETVSGRGQRYGDQEMLRRGEEMMERAVRMQQEGIQMMQRGNRMMR